MKWLALAMVLVGCGPEGWTYTSDCVTFESQVGLYQSKIDRNVSLAKAMFDGRFGSGEFCRVARQPVRVRTEYTWECSAYKEGCSGWADVFGVQLNRIGTALFHELVHIWEIDAGIVSTGDHSEWEAKGYYALDLQFRWESGIGGYWDDGTAVTP